MTSPARWRILSTASHGQCCICAGNRNVRDVLAVVFAYIALIKGPGGVSQQIWEENRQLSRLRFDFRDKPQPMALAEALSGSMQTHEDRCRLIGCG